MQKIASAITLIGLFGIIIFGSSCSKGTTCRCETVTIRTDSTTVMDTTVVGADSTVIVMDTTVVGADIFTVENRNYNCSSSDVRCPAADGLPCIYEHTDENGNVSTTYPDSIDYVTLFTCLEQ